MHAARKNDTHEKGVKPIYEIEKKLAFNAPKWEVPSPKKKILLGSRNIWQKQNKIINCSVVLLKNVKLFGRWHDRL